jgi:hypothetical protein
MFSTFTQKDVDEVGQAHQIVISLHNVSPPVITEPTHGDDA